MKNRKGFMHAIEGIMATLLLLGYMYYAVSPPLQENSWTYTSSKQESEAYLNTISQTDISSLIVENKDDVIESLNSYFLESSGITIKTENLIKPELSIGVVHNHTKDPVIYFNAVPTSEDVCNSNGWLTNTSCILNASAANRFKKDIILADTSDDGTLLYNSIYVDLNENSHHDSGEGPLLTNTFICMNGSTQCLGGELYYTGYIDNTSKKVALWNGSKIMDYVRNIRSISINNRTTIMKVYGADLDRDLSKFDVLIIAEPMDLTAYEQKLEDFLKQGKGIIEVSNITSSNYQPVQMRIFGIEKKDGYNITQTNGNTTVFFDNSDSLYKESVSIAGYYTATPMRVMMSEASGYDFSIFGDKYPSKFRAGVVNLGRYNASIAIYNTSQIYDLAYIDMPADKNYSTMTYYSSTNDTLYQGSVVTLPNKTVSSSEYRQYLIKSIDPNGEYVDLEPYKNDDNSGYFLGGKNPANVVPVGNAYSEVEYYYRYYNISSYNISQRFGVDLIDDAGGKKKGNLNVGGGYGINVNLTVENSSLYIDLNGDLDYNEPGEGPFFKTDSIKVGPETYYIVKMKSSKVTFGLTQRDHVPFSIMNRVYSGKTVWMPAMAYGGDDEWNYLRSAILWASDKKGKMGVIKGYKNLASIKKVLIASGDVYQPYIAEIVVGYND